LPGFQEDQAAASIHPRQSRPCHGPLAPVRWSPAALNAAQTFVDGWQEIVVWTKVKEGKQHRPVGVWSLDGPGE
jgi:hypothetical protein